jgi:high-affinity iron transporter
MYGVMVAADKAVNVPVLIAGAMALLASVMLFGLVQLSSRSIARTLCFRICELIFFIIAGSLLLGAIDRLIALGFVPTLTSPLWDTSLILDDNGLIGGMISGLTGYRSRPELIVVLVLGLYWIAIAGLLRLRNRQAVTR